MSCKTFSLFIIEMIISTICGSNCIPEQSLNLIIASVMINEINWY